MMSGREDGVDLAPRTVKAVVNIGLEARWR